MAGGEARPWWRCAVYTDMGDRLGLTMSNDMSPNDTCGAPQVMKYQVYNCAEPSEVYKARLYEAHTVQSTATGARCTL